MKIKFLIICLFTVLRAGAYNDYRNARVDSLETALASKNPPKGADLLRAYDELMRGYLPFDSIKASNYGHKALALSYELNGLRVRQDVLRRFAQMHYAREEFDEAIRIFQQALAVVDSMEHDKRYTPSDVDDARSCLYGAIGNVYNMQDKVTEKCTEKWNQLRNNAENVWIILRKVVNLHPKRWRKVVR